MIRVLPRQRLIVLACVLVLAVAGVLWWVLQSPGTKITAYFDKAIGLYAGSSVRVLGVQVGKIDTVQPQGNAVRVDMHVDSDVSIPAGAKAVVVAPSLVSDRYVQLTPAYDGGPKMPSGAVIPEQRTMTPAELDDLYRSANSLAHALGPQGANSNGAVSNLLNTTAANLNGNGDQINNTMQQLSDLSATLSNNKDDLFSTVDNLNKFTATLAQSDGQVKDLSNHLAEVTGFLASEHDQVGTALNSLAGALGDVNGFIQNNRQSLSTNVNSLTSISQALVNQRNALSEVLDIMPTATTNFINAYDAPSGTVATRGVFNELSYPMVLMVCELVKNGAPKPIPPQLTQTCSQLSGVLDGTLRLPSINEILGDAESGQQPTLPLPLAQVQQRLQNASEAGNR